MAPATVAPALRAANAEVVVNAAAYTDVDKAESEPEVVDAVNSRGAGAVAAAASALGLPLVHLSTDYVFAGALDRPYREDAPTRPRGAYGRSRRRDARRRTRRCSSDPGSRNPANRVGLQPVRGELREVHAAACRNQRYHRR